VEQKRGRVVSVEVEVEVDGKGKGAVMEKNWRSREWKKAAGQTGKQKADDDEQGRAPG
jgi:hypothetical protein